MTEINSYLKQIVNKVKDFELESSIFLLISLLHQNKTIPKLRYSPYYLLLLIYWFLMFSGKNSKKKILDVNEVNKLYNRLNKCPIPELENSAIFKLIRPILHQQLWYQSYFNLTDYGRTLKMFYNLEQNHSINTVFLETYDITIDEYLDLQSYVFLFVTGTQLKVISPKNFPETIREKVITFLDSFLSRNLDEYRSHLVSNRLNDYYFQYLEKSPLSRYPFIKFNEDYYLIANELLQENFQYMIYGIVKPDQKARQKFELLYENYVKEILHHHKIPIIHESLLKLKCIDSKCVDFFYKENDITISIECKAIEMRKLVQINPTEMNMKKYLKNTILKAYTQGSDFINNYNEHDFNKSNNFLFIVTYRELILGPPKEYWDEFVKENVKDFDESTLPPENVFIMSIIDFEQIVYLHSIGELSLKDFLSRAVENNEQVGSSNLLINMHLTDEEKGKIKLEFLNDIANEFIESIPSKIA